MQVCISLQTDNHASISPLSFFTGRMPFLPPNQQHLSTEGMIDSEWQWHQLGHMQVCTLLQTDNMPFLPPNQQCQTQSTEGK